MKPLDNAEMVLPELVAFVEERVPYASALYTESGGLGIQLAPADEQVYSLPMVRGVVLSAWTGSHTEEYATATTDPDALAREVKEWARHLHREPETGPAPDPGAPLQQRFDGPCAIDPASRPASQKLAHLRDLRDRTGAVDQRIFQTRVRYSDRTEQKFFCNRQRNLVQRLVRTQCIVTTLARQDGGAPVYDWFTSAGLGGVELADISEGDLRGLVNNTTALLRATPITPGEYDCITAPDVSGLVAHESFGHGVEMDMYLKERARSAHYLGKPVASPLVNIFDDPTVPGASGTYFFDDEGQIATPTAIIRDGIFLRGISDNYSATRLGLPRTANGRRESYAAKSYARMSNTFFGTGETPFETMLAGVEDGVYLRRGHSGMEDPQGWGIQLVIHYGEEIKNGQLTGRVFSPIGVTGYVPDVLQSITQVGDTARINNAGMCGKGHKEWIYVSDGGPHLRLRARLG